MPTLQELFEQRVLSAAQEMIFMQKECGWTIDEQLERYNGAIKIKHIKAKIDELTAA